MKKIVCFFMLFFLVTGLHAFDRALFGSWGLVLDGEKEEFINFGNNEIVLLGERYRHNEFVSTDDTIILGEEGVIIQYFRLSAGKLLFIMWDIDEPTLSITLILSRL